MACQRSVVAPTCRQARGFVSGPTRYLFFFLSPHLLSTHSVPGTALGTKDTALTIGQNILSLIAAIPIIILVAMVITTLQKHQLEFQGRPILSPEAAGPNLEERLQSFSSHLHLSGLRFSKMKWMGESSVSTRQQEGRAGGMVSQRAFRAVCCCYDDYC